MLRTDINTFLIPEWPNPGRGLFRKRFGTKLPIDNHKFALTPCHCVRQG